MRVSRRHARRPAWSIGGPTAGRPTCAAIAAGAVIIVAAAITAAAAVATVAAIPITVANAVGDAGAADAAIASKYMA